MWAHSLRVQSAVWEGMVGGRTLLGVVSTVRKQRER